MNTGEQTVNSHQTLPFAWLQAAISVADSIILRLLRVRWFVFREFVLFIPLLLMMQPDCLERRSCPKARRCFWSPKRFTIHLRRRHWYQMISRFRLVLPG